MEVVMDTMWDKIKKSLKDGASLSMEKIEEYTKLGKLKIEELSAKRKIERNFMDMGERTFDLVESGKDGSAISTDLVIKKSIESVKALRDELIEIEKKMKEVTEANKKSKDENADDDSSDEINGI
jgi:hypothetical protein